MTEAYRTWTRRSKAYDKYAEASRTARIAFYTPKPECNAWTHPGTGQTRYYINNIEQLIGLEINRYKSGNVSSAWLLGEGGISNGQANKILSQIRNARIYAVATNNGPKVVITARYPDSRVITLDEIVERVTHCITIHGI